MMEGGRGWGVEPDSLSAAQSSFNSLTSPSSLLPGHSRWCMATITEHNDSSACNLLFHLRGQGEGRLAWGGFTEERRQNCLGVTGEWVGGGIGRRRKMMCHTILGCRGGGRRRRSKWESSRAEPVWADGWEDKVLDEQRERKACIAGEGKNIKVLWATLESLDSFR